MNLHFAATDETPSKHGLNSRCEAALRKVLVADSLTKVAEN